MSRPSLLSSALVPIVLATLVSLALYSQQALLLLLKVGEVFSGVFDTSVPAFPLAGMLFVLTFILLRWKEFSKLLSDRGRDTVVAVAGLGLTLLPLPALLLSGRSLGGSYVFAAIALATCWVGVMSIVRPPVFHFLWPYLIVYAAAVGSVTILTTFFGDPLAIAVASVSNTITSVFNLPVQWSSVNIMFTAAGGGQVSLYISQECSGIASISIFLLLTGLMHLDVKPTVKTTAAVAIGGSLLFVFLNALRVVALIVGGIYGGVDLLWSLHGWVGYVFYIIGYTGILLAYMRYVRKQVPVRSTPRPSSGTRTTTTERVAWTRASESRDCGGALTLAAPHNWERGGTLVH